MSFKGFVGCNRRISKEEQQFYELKNKAAEYYRANAVPQKIEGVLNQMFSDKPDDIYGYLANYFTTFSTPPVISRVFGKDIYDGKGQLSVQAEVFCVIRNEEKKTCSAAISSHCESLEDSPQNPSGVVALGNTNTRRVSVTTAVRWINDPLSVMLRGCDPCDQAGVDKILSDFFMARYLEEQDLRGQEEVQAPSQPPPEPAPPSAPSKDKKPGDRGKKGGGGGENAVPPPEPRERALPGGEAVGAVSLGVAKTGALLRGVPLYRHVSALRNRQEVAELHIPVPLVTLLSCGKTSPGKLNLLDEVILIPKAGQRVKQVLTTALELQREMRNIMMNASSKTGPVLVCLSESGALAAGYERPEQALDLLTEACSNLGLALGTDLHLALNCAAHELMDYSKGKYDVTTGSPKSPDEMVDLYEVLISKYPAVTTLMDPLRREDREQWQRLSAVIGASCALLSDAASRPPNYSVREDAPPLPGVRGHVLKQTNETTVSDLIRISAEHKGAVVVGTTCGEPCSDDSLSDVAVGVGAAYIKLGGLNGGERLTKYNRLIAIEEELLQQGLLDSRRAHPPPLFNEPPEQSPE